METKEQQQQLSLEVEEINRKIGEINQEPQELRNYESIKVKQMLLHTDVEKITFKKRNGEKTNVRKQISKTTLPDGIHANENIVKKWFDLANTNLLLMLNNSQKK